MSATSYSTRAWRELPRDGDCVVAFLFGDAVGGCRGVMHRHHVDPDDGASRSVQVCAGHHPTLQAALRTLRGGERQRRRCGHRHPYDHGRRECERHLNEA